MRNLAYCTIKSPVKGIIIDRRVNIGQTVVSSLSAPSLFLIAKDLRRLQVWISVNEADIGNIHPGQPVTFTVDAFPNQTFKGSVGKVRLAALHDVDNALVAYAGEKEHHQALAEAVKANQQAVDLSLKLYSEGQTDFLNVLTAQQSLYLAQDSLAQSESGLSTDIVALYKALGGGWSEADLENPECGPQQKEDKK